MRNSGLMLGIIGGLWAMLIGFFSYGYVEYIATYGEVADLAEQVTHPYLIQSASFLAPLLAIAGGAMSRSQHVLGGVLMIAASALVWIAFGFGVFTMFPIGFCLLGGVLSLTASQPDPH